jgi:hypothetical protein
MSPRLSACSMTIAVSLSLFVLPAAVVAQDSPPAYLQIFREVVKPGRNGPHVPLEAAWSQAFARAKVPVYVLAMTTMYGPPEAWFLQGNESVAEIDEVNKAVEAAPGLGAETDRFAQADAANISSFTSILARHLPDLSNNSNFDQTQMRVWEVLIFQVRPGHEADFDETAKLYKSTLGQAKIDAPWVTYGVMAGMPGPTYLVFVPHRTLAEIDPATGTGAAIQKAFTVEAMKKLSSLAEGFAEVETLVFGVSPQMSNLRAEFIARDPKFWTPKPQPAKRRAPTPQPGQ